MGEVKTWTNSPDLTSELWIVHSRDFSPNEENEDFYELKGSLLTSSPTSIFKEASQLEVAFRHNFFLYAVAWLQSFGGLQTDCVMPWLCNLLLD